jgi:CheY-like chemotaxis protein
MSVKTILIAHHSAAVRDRFAAALADARQEYLVAGTAPTLRAALSGASASINLALVDLRLAGDTDPLRFVGDIRTGGARPVPVVVFAGSVSSADQIAGLGQHGVSGYINEHAETHQILPALAPHLFPDSFNRRASERASVSLPISFRAGQTIAAAETRDVGRGGIGIRTMQPLPGGTPLQLTLKLPGESQDLSAFGRVIWSDRRVGMGVQFEKLTGAAQQVLEDFLRAESGAGKWGQG